MVTGSNRHHLIDTGRASTAEQKAKHVQEELKCQRQNAESSRVQHQQRTKELEKQHQRDLQEFQKERQFMERQHQQDINKLNQELSQARAQHNVLQAQLEKESVHKQSLVKELDTLKEKLKWTEGQLQHSQKKEAQAQAKIVEASREAEALTASLKQSQKKEKSLEDDGRRLTEERDHARCLLRELQEQKAAITPIQPLQICAPVQTFSNASLYQTRKPSPTHTAKQKGEEVNRPLEIKVPYPTDREPGEGIDSEHLSDNLFIKSEDLQREECESQTKREDVFEDVQRHSSQTISQGSPSKQKNLLAENAALHSELKDTQEELQKRLDDLETQRRAETEARTRLKLLSRKNASQVTEKEEQYKECKSQLEKERSEVERLKKALAASETLTTREGEKCDENNTVLQDKADEMIELNMELKKQLSEVKAQLVLEREERKQHKAEIMNKESADMEKIQGLQSEIEQLKASLNDSSQMVKGPGATNSPVTYLCLREDEDSDAVDNKPETLSSCMGNSQQNAMSLSQVLSLQKQNSLEKERAHEYQIKLEILQNQVTQQTQQLTMAFEMQSKHISGLLTLKEQMPTVLCDVSVQTCTEAQQSGKEPGSQQLDQISHLQQQVVALQAKLQVLCEENQQKTEELAVWRLCSEPCALTESQPVTLLREDEILLSCSSNKLQGRTLFSRFQTNQISEMKALHPFSILQEHNKNNSQSDKENTAPAPENQRDDGKSLCRGLEPFEDRVKSVGSQTEPELQPHAQEEVTELEKEPASAAAAVHCSKDAISTAAFPISADPATLAERIRRSRAQLSAAFDDTEYEPYGLPEVVMKGFADIPTGPSCPYIVRRGLLGTAAVPVFPKNMTDAEETD
uniref:Kinetochore protein Cenp-F/LEK1 Rb protein-binding domain-containing protein n=1 Tax=Knipowitschia caucasica TaxID=637954 RepID=A0AAV2MJM7_KNICA